MPSTLRVVLAEDSYLVLQGIRRLLETQPSIEVLATCADLAGLQATVDRAQPDVVVTDIRMPPASTDEGIRAAATFRDQYPNLGVIVLSQHDEPEYALRLLERGSARRAYLLKDSLSDAHHLIEAIRVVADGGSVIDPKMVETLVAALSIRMVEKHINAMFSKLHLSEEPDVHPRVKAVLLYLADSDS